MTPPLRPESLRHGATVFFDIDGTLLLTRRGRRAMNEAFHRQFGVKNAFDDISFAGATDPDVFQTICDRNDITPSPGDKAVFFNDYYQRLDHIFDGRINILPGSHEILRVLRRKPVHLGIITGNNPGSAFVKLRQAGFLDYFEGGAYGSDGPVRADIVEAGVRRFQANPDRTVLIGDSVHDIRTGKQHDLTTVAVPTGTTDAETLRREDPDLFVPGLSPDTELLNALQVQLEVTLQVN